MLWGPDHRRLLPLSVIVGAGFLILTDLAARTIIEPAELPIGVITAIIRCTCICLYFDEKKNGK